VINVGRLYLGLALLCCSACTKAAPDPYTPITVDEAEADIASLNGYTITVQGWLSDPCGGMSCAIFPTPTRKGQDWPPGAHLSIASETLAETALNTSSGKQVRLTGVMSSQCRGFRTFCSDRAPDITPVSLKIVVTPTKDN
jgi:hypothetical protein